jgi:hypothetical protein
VAKEQGWISTDCLRSDDLTKIACDNYRTIAASYDAVWIVPGQILVSADPVTTMCDPNPATFSALFPSDEKPEPVPEADADRTLDGSVLQDLVYPGAVATLGVDEIQLEPSPRSAGCKIVTPPMSSQTHSPNSAHTVDKDYVCEGFFMHSRASKAMAYSSFAQECGVSMVIRANFDQESGMPMKSYDAQRWKECDIGHTDIQFEDHGGGLPLPSSMASLLEIAEKMSKELFGAVLIHCKGGFGRSVVLCCCLAIYKYNLPGSSLLGWSRIVRPGAITTPQQEKFLLSMKGRADVLKFAKKTRPQFGEIEASDGANVGCNLACAVQ